jgi:hypothetical protein
MGGAHSMDEGWKRCIGFGGETYDNFRDLGTDERILPYFPVNNARVIYTKMFSKRKKTMVRVIHKVRVMHLKSKKFQNT